MCIRDRQKTVPISNAIFDTITKHRANDTSPLSGKYNNEVNKQQSKVKKTNNDFLYPVLSANAPRIGEINATIMAVIDIACAHKNVPSISSGAI